MNCYFCQQPMRPGERVGAGYFICQHCPEFNYQTQDTIIFAISKDNAAIYYLATSTLEVLGEANKVISSFKIDAPAKITDLSEQATRAFNLRVFS